jgi:integrase
MGRALAVPAKAKLPAALTELVDQARDYVAAARSDNTRRGYDSDWRMFADWCASQGLEAMPPTPQTVALYLTAHAGTLKVSTLQRRLSGLAHAAKQAGHDLDTRNVVLRDLWRGIKRTHGTAPSKKAPTVTPVVLAMLVAVSEGLQGIRDRALILTGFAGAFRRSELAALELRDLAFGPDGVAITLRRSKTDQEGEGAKVGLPHGHHRGSCPVAALRAWIEAAGLTEGRVFRSINRHGQVGGGLSDKTVVRIVKRLTDAAGLDAASYSGHSMRSGFATSAANLPERLLMKHARWKSVTIARGYIQEASLFVDNPAGKIGL